MTSHHAILERMIHTQEILHGEPLSENRAAKILGVSKRTAREALLKLEAKGLVSKGERGRSGGRRVLDQEVFEDEDPEVFLERLEMRDALLSEAACLAAHQMNAWQAKRFQALAEGEWQGTDHDDRFKSCCDYLIQHCGNRLLQKMWKQFGFTAFVVRDPDVQHAIEEAAAQIKTDSLKDDGDRFVPGVAEAIVERDAEAAHRVMHEFHQITIHGYRAVADRAYLSPDLPNRKESEA